MKNALLALLLLFSFNVRAQDVSYDPQYEVRGNGKPVHLTPTIKSFDRLEIMPFQATIIVDAGATETLVDVSVDENLKPFLQINSEGGKLSIFFQRPQGKPIWVSSDLIKVTIKTPNLNNIRYNNNSNLLVQNLHGEALGVINRGNARVTLLGSVKTMTLTNQGNGTVRAEQLNTDKATVVSSANGSVRLNAKDMETVNTGHGEITNVALKNRDKDK